MTAAHATGHLSRSCANEVPLCTAAVAASLLLMGCQSKRDIFAQFDAGYPLSEEQLASYYKRLGIEHPMPEGMLGRERTIERFCHYYES